MKLSRKELAEHIGMNIAKKIISIDGNLTPFIQNLQYFKDLIASNRQSNN